MAGLRERILEDLRKDYLADPERSLLFLYFLEEHQSGFRIAAKVLLMELDVEGPGADCLARLQAHLFGSLLREQKFRNLYAVRALDGLRGGAESPKKANLTIRAGITEMMDRGTVWSERKLRALAEELLGSFPEENPASRFMECWLDLQAARIRGGGQAPQTGADFEAGAAAVMREICGKQKLNVEVPVPVTAEIYLRLRDMLVCAEAEAWLLDTGWSVKKDTRGQAPARRKNIPIELIERYLERKMPAGPDGSAGSAAAAPAWLEDNASAARDAAALYRAMNTEEYRQAVVPLKIDRATGAGIYLLGCGYFEDLLPRLPRSEERLRELLGTRHAVIAEVAHAQAVLDILYAMPGFAGNVTARSWFWENVRVFELPVTERTLAALFDDFDGAVRYAAAQSGEGLFAPFADVNEEAPEHCPERYLAYFSGEEI